ncbi:MAG TPA: cytochrome c biogenesis protein CcsA [Chitinophagaceae bacterium]|nr:cytochrome c biogenesis protein CcsA [Chitinophagaceae bacterium]
MDYFGEHLLPGQLGRFFIALSLVASIVATFAYFKSAQSKIDTDAGNWKKLARYAFITEVISVVAIFSVLFYIIQNHLFEYKYAWQHSSLSLEPKYMLACFWEGQEGSFLLWSVWHCILGLILIKTGKTWEAPVMTVVSFAQFCLATMIAGIYIFNQKIGSSPFILLRDSGVLDNVPALHLNFDTTQPLRPDYMSSITDGNDLNVLLQNYWMVIHPPVLFLGFASTTIPFAFATAGLWKKNFGEWTKPALPWSLFSAAVLGVGIMMGAAWAYESLSFGGYWAWDPVENASLVPWLILIAGIHTLLIYKHSGHSLRAAHLFLILSFFFVLYSTFLTRSGVLGDTSVHAFTDLGMNIQLYMLLYLFFWLPALLSAKSSNQKMITGITGIALLGLTLLAHEFVINLVPLFAFSTLLAGIGFIIYQIQTQVPTIHKEENSSSREFWMFIGALLFFLSALVIISITSLPVLNKIINIKKAAPEEQELLYNKIHIFVAIIIAALTAFTQYLRYKSTPVSLFWKKIWLPTLISIIAGTLAVAFGNINYNKQGPVFLGAIWLAIVCCIYTIIANASYIWIGMKGKLLLSGGSVAHVGFGMVLLGILLSSSKKEILSYNTSGIFAPLEENKITGQTGENLTLLKGQKNDMGKYWVTFEKSEKHPEKEKWFYDIRFQKKGGKEEFVLTPSAFINVKGNAGLQAEPDARHYWDHDVFAYITSVIDPEKNKDTSNFRTTLLKPGDSLFYTRGYMILQDVKPIKNVPQQIAEILGNDGSLNEASLKIYSKTGSIFSSTTKLAYIKGTYLPFPDTVIAENLVLQLQKVNADKSIELGVKESNTVSDYLTLKAYKFPFILVLWAGVIITAVGILISMVRRIQLNRSEKA